MCGLAALSHTVSHLNLIRTLCGGNDHSQLHFIGLGRLRGLMACAESLRQSQNLRDCKICAFSSLPLRAAVGS